MASKGKSTIDVEVDTSKLSELVKLAEKYRDVLKESNAVLKENVAITTQASKEHEKLNKTAGEGARSRREYRRREKSEDDLFPEGRKYRNAQGTFTKRPTWSQPKEAGTGSQFSAGWEKPPASGSLSDMDRLRWGPGRNNTGSGQFKGNWERAPKPGTLSDLDRLPWGPGRDSTGSGQFKATFEKFAKGNDKWNESFYQMFSTGRMSQNILRNMFSGNLIKMLGIGGTAAALGYAINEGAAVGAQQRLQATGIGGDIGRMKSAQVELARFGPVQPGLEAANRAKSMIGDEFAAYTFMGFSPEEIKNMDPSTMYAQLMIRAQKKLKGYTPQAMGNLFEAQHLGSILPGGIGQATRLIGMSGQETKEAAEAVEANAKYLETTQEQQKALTNLSTTLNLASSEIQTHFINKLADIAPAIDNFIKNQMNKINEGPEAAPGLKPGGIFNSENWGWGGPILGGKPAAPTTGPRPDGKLRPVPRLHSPLNNPPLESNIQGSGAVDEGNGGVIGGVTRVSIFSPKIAKLNKDVTDTSKSLAEFNEQLLRGSRIMFGGSGQYLASKFGQGGGGGRGGGGGGLESGATPRYDTGGIGDTAMPRTLGEGTIGKGSGISSSGLGGGKYTGGTESNTIDTNAPEISQLPGDKTWGDYGTRANNPGNLNYAGWEGAVSKFSYTDPQTHGQHTMGVFKTMPEGVAAAYKLLIRNQAKNGKTLQGALKGWAENGYIGPLAKSLGIDPNDQYDLSTADPEKVAGMLEQQFKREGRKGSHTATHEQILAGINLGRGLGAASTGDGKTITGGGGSSGGGGASGSWDDSAVDTDFFKSRASGEVSKTEGINPEFGADLKRATEAAEKATGQKVQFTSLVRDSKKQAELYYNYIHHIGGQGLAAKPGTSLHEKGMAADLAEGPARDYVRAHAVEYGMELVPGDPEHVQIARDRRAIAEASAREAGATRTASRSGPHPHIGDMSQYNTNQAIKVNVNNAAGADVATQTAMIGSSQGNFG